MRYELEILERIMFYDETGTMTRFPLYIYRTKEKIEKKALETAINCAIQCHPIFGCRLEEDEKGPYLETNPEKPIIPDLNPEDEFYYGNEANHCYPWIIGVHENEIIYTGYHGIADGMGVTAFMRTVLYYYFKEQGIDCDPGKAATLEEITPEYLEKVTECSVRKNGAEDRQSLQKSSELQPTVFPDEMLEENPENCAVHNLAISLEDIRKKSAAYGVSQFAVLATYIAQAVCSVLPGEENVTLMNIIVDMRGTLNSVTSHNCVMSVPIMFSQKDLTDKDDEFICKLFRSKLDLGFNHEEALHNCFTNTQMEQQIGGSKEYLSGTAAQITQQFGFTLPIASVTYTHLTHTGFSDDLFNQLEDVYINYAGFKKEGKQGIRELNAVTTDRVINLMIIDGTKNEQIVSALEKRLSDAQISFESSTLEKYRGIIYRR